MRGPTFFSFLLVEIKRFRYFGVQTFVQLLRHHKRQIPGVGRNVYVWQLNAVLPTTGLILHPGDSRELGGWKGANGRSQVPCLWLPADALSLDAPSWCWTPTPQVQFQTYMCNQTRQEEKIGKCWQRCVFHPRSMTWCLMSHRRLEQTVLIDHE